MLLGVFPMCLALIVILYTLPVQSSRVAIEFEPESATEAFIKASAEYDAIWKAEGIRTIEAMERVTGITFEERRMKAMRGSAFPAAATGRCTSERATRRT
jgi:hypothetical protein